ncbi:hypothetical protein A5684_11275 [Mycobacterium intracellulare]|nr:hypothetical protein A5684_11275 [Mycobacterium intracellulare]
MHGCNFGGREVSGCPFNGVGLGRVIGIGVPEVAVFVFKELSVSVFGQLAKFFCIGKNIPRFRRLVAAEIRMIAGRMAVVAWVRVMRRRVAIAGGMRAVAIAGRMWSAAVAGWVRTTAMRLGRLGRRFSRVRYLAEAGRRFGGEAARRDKGEGRRLR